MRDTDFDFERIRRVGDAVSSSSGEAVWTNDSVATDDGEDCGKVSVFGIDSEDEDEFVISRDRDSVSINEEEASLSLVCEVV